MMRVLYIRDVTIYCVDDNRDKKQKYWYSVTDPVQMWVFCRFVHCCIVTVATAVQWLMAAIIQFLLRLLLQRNPTK